MYTSYSSKMICCWWLQKGGHSASVCSASLRWAIFCLFGSLSSFSLIAIFSWCQSGKKELVSRLVVFHEFNPAFQNQMQPFYISLYILKLGNISFQKGNTRINESDIILYLFHWWTGAAACRRAPTMWQFTANSCFTLFFIHHLLLIPMDKLKTNLSSRLGVFLEVNPFSEIGCKFLLHINLHTHAILFRKVKNK